MRGCHFNSLQIYGFYTPEERAYFDLSIFYVESRKEKEVTYTALRTPPRPPHRRLQDKEEENKGKQQNHDAVP